MLNDYTKSDCLIDDATDIRVRMIPTGLVWPHRVNNRDSASGWD